MHVRRLTASTLLVLAFLAAPAFAQTTAGSGSVVILPSVAFIPGAFTTTVFVYNPNAAPITLNLDYYQSDSSTTPLPGGTALDCGQIAVPSLNSVNFNLEAKCNFTGTSDNFGQLVLQDAAAVKTNSFFAYSRALAPSNNGFSIEGFPAGNFSSQTAHAIGLQKTLTAPHFRSNCFVGALGEAVNYTIVLRQSNGSALGSPIQGSLSAYHTVRFLDVFNAAGVASGNYSNIRATFSNSTGSAMIGFCTVETTENGSADFRVAKSMDANDTRQSRLACYGMDSCFANLPSVTNPATISSSGSKNIHYFIVDQPDFVKCDLIVNAGDVNGLEIMLRGPGNPQSAPQFNIAALPPPYNTSPYTSGGVGAQSFYVYTGEKSTIASGATTRWYVDVSYNQSSGKALPIDYGIKCTSGNGVTVPWLGTTGPSNP